MRVLTLQTPRRPVDGDVQLPFDPAAPATYLQRRAANFGDYVVIDSMLRLVDVEFVANIQYAEPNEGPLPEADHLIIRGSNYIRPNLDLTSMGELIERLGLPVTVMGIGAQVPQYGSLDLPEGTIRALRILGEHSTVVGARGEYTAEILRSLGVDNVEPVGCPSFFRAMNRDLTIDFDPDQRGSVAYNLNRDMAGIYGSDHLLIIRMQRDFFIQLKRLFDGVSTICQGERPEFIAAYRLEEHYDTLRRALTRGGFADGDDDPIIEELIESAECPSSIGDWERRVGRHDLVFGMRFHGTTVGLANGLPSIYLVNDTRIHEMATHFGVPYVDLRNLDAPPSVEAILADADFGVFNAQYADRFDRFAAYLIGNGLPSRIQPGAPIEPERRQADSEVHAGPDAAESARWLRSQLSWADGRIGELQGEVDVQARRAAKKQPAAPTKPTRGRARRSVSKVVRRLGLR